MRSGFWINSSSRAFRLFDNSTGMNQSGMHFRNIPHMLWRHTSGADRQHALTESRYVQTSGSKVEWNKICRILPSLCIVGTNVGIPIRL